MISDSVYSVTVSGIRITRISVINGGQMANEESKDIIIVQCFLCVQQRGMFENAPYMEARKAFPAKLLVKEQYGGMFSAPTEPKDVLHDVYLCEMHLEELTKEETKEVKRMSSMN